MIFFAASSRSASGSTSTGLEGSLSVVLLLFFATCITKALNKSNIFRQRRGLWRMAVLGVRIHRDCGSGIMMAAKVSITKYCRTCSLTHFFPPSNNVTGVRSSDAADMTIRPTVGLPVYIIWSNRWLSSALATGTSPSTAAKTFWNSDDRNEQICHMYGIQRRSKCSLAYGQPTLSKYCCTRPANTVENDGAHSDNFRTTVFPEDVQHYELSLAMRWKTSESVVPLPIVTEFDCPNKRL